MPRTWTLRWAVALVALLAMLIAGAACAGDPEDDRTAADFAGEELVLLTHDSFAISEETIAAFEAQYGVTVEVVPIGDAVEALNRAILNKGNPEGDLLFGVDNVFYARALEEEIFVEYRSPELARVDEALIFDDSGHLTPIDFGYVLLNYDKASLEEAGLEPPRSLRELTEPQWRGRVAVQDPNTSSPGLQFMLVTVAHFGEDGDYTWLDFWRDMRANDVIVSAGWSDAYYTQFSRYGGNALLVTSYTTSPPAEVMFAEEPLDDAPTGSVLAPNRATSRSRAWASCAAPTSSRWPRPSSTSCWASSSRPTSRPTCSSTPPAPASPSRRSSSATRRSPTSRPASTPTPSRPTSSAGWTSGRTRWCGRDAAGRAGAPEAARCGRAGWS